MKTMTCRQLGGVCDHSFSAESFEEIAEMSHKHGNDMAAKGDEDHLKAMADMRLLMQKPGAMEEWIYARKEEFNSLPDE